MKNRHAEFVISASEPSGFPAEDLPEVAIVGRSNVGKSSLINALVGINRLARTSNTPGRTRLLNWFRVAGDTPFHFVDLPGYGYAKVPRDMRDAWRPLIEAYLSSRSTLCGVILLHDARRDIDDDQVSLIAWLGESDIPWQLVVTKIDKLPKNKRKLVGETVKRALKLSRPPVLTSAESKDGLEDLWKKIHRLVAG